MGWFENMFSMDPDAQKKAMADIEAARQSGAVFSADKMDASHQAALKTLLQRQNDTPDSPLEEEAKRRAKILGATK